MFHSYRAIYAGSFDPPTLGHLWMINEAINIFPRILVAVGENKSKNPMFSVGARIEMLRELCDAESDAEKVDVVSFKDKYLVDFAQETQAEFIIRGIRSNADYEYESVMHEVNMNIQDLEVSEKYAKNPISTIFLMPPKNLSMVSSSMVKALIGPNGWQKIVRKYVPEIVLEQLKKKYAKQNS